jgi:epoxyqueuosine reductase
LKSQIIALAHDLNIQKIGFAKADDFESLRPRLEAQQQAGHTSGFEHQNLDERLQPQLTMPKVKTLISVALAYPNKLQAQPTKTQYKRGQFARASWGIDYHNIMKDKLQQLADGIKQLANEQADFQAYVDTGPLIDVAVAQRAGLGFIGKNGLLITKEYGSWVYLGELMTDLEIEPDQSVDYNCGDCERCLTACPTQALQGDGSMNAKRCLSFQTQNKGPLQEEFRTKIRTTIYGCDICQISCPYNKGVDAHFHKEMEGEPDLVKPELLPMLENNNRAFKAKFGHLAGSWRGNATLQRNAIYALGNLRDQSAVPRLLELLETSTNETLQDAALWSLSKIVKHPNDDLTNFIKGLKLPDQARENLLKTWYN